MQNSVGRRSCFQTLTRVCLHVYFIVHVHVHVYLSAPPSPFRWVPACLCVHACPCLQVDVIVTSMPSMRGPADQNSLRQLMRAAENLLSTRAG